MIFEVCYISRNFFLINTFRIWKKGRITDKKIEIE